MAENSKIEWTHHAANLWWGCSKVHKGCDNCYAERWSNRFGDDIWGNKPRKEIKSVWNDLVRFQRLAAKANETHIEWAYTMRDRCKSLDIPYFFKQIDKVLPIPEDLQIRQFPQ